MKYSVPFTRAGRIQCFLAGVFISLCVLWGNLQPVEAGCTKFGHSCFGAHGKRAQKSFPFPMSSTMNEQVENVDPGFNQGTSEGLYPYPYYAPEMLALRKINGAGGRPFSNPMRGMFPPFQFEDSKDQSDAEAK